MAAEYPTTDLLRGMIERITEAHGRIDELHRQAADRAHAEHEARRQATDQEE